MKVTYSEAAKQSGEGTVLLEQATNMLEKVLSPSAGQVQAHWDRVGSNYQLRISDWTLPAGKTAEFAPDELSSPLHMRVRLHQLWGDLLRARNEMQLQALSESGE